MHFSYICIVERNDILIIKKLKDMKRVNYSGLALKCLDFYYKYRSDFTILLDDDSIIVYELRPSSMLECWFNTMFPRFMRFRVRVDFIKEHSITCCTVYFAVKNKNRICYHTLNITSDDKFQHTWHF